MKAPVIRLTNEAHRGNPAVRMSFEKESSKSTPTLQKILLKNLKTH
jgi:hypothetical protein